MLEKISLQNFKAFKAVVIKPGVITVLIGPNRTGKSSVLQALALMKQSAGSTALQLSGPIVNLGSFEEIIPKAGEGGPPTFDLTWRTHLSLSSTTKDVTFNLLAFFFGPTSFVQNVSIRMDSYEWSGYHNQPPPPLSFLSQWQIEIAPGGGLLQPFRIVAVSYQGAAPDALSEQELRHFAEQLLSVAADSLQHKTFFVPPIRGFDRAAYEQQGAMQTDLMLGLGYEKTSEQALTTWLYSEELWQKIGDWSEEVVETRLRVRPIPGRSVSSRAKDKHNVNVDVNVVLEGYGVNQLAYLFLQLALAPESSLVAIEEPEIHLHPASQAKLADLFVKVAKEEQKQIMMTTHSEHILMRLLTRVADGTLKPEDLAVYYFEKDERGVASATKLTVNERGQLEEGLKGFFEASTEELKTYLDALAPKKRK